MRRLAAILPAMATLPAAAAVTEQAGTVAAALSGEALTAAGTTVLTLFLLAVLLESALALLFNWRPFIETFNARATRPLLAFVVTLLAVHAYDYDAVTALMDAVQKAPTRPPQAFGKIMTAAILAGGSAGVNTMLVALGFRELKTAATMAPKVAADRAWIAIQVARQTVQGELNVHIGPPDTANPPDPGKLPLVGVIGASSKVADSGLGRFFLRQPGRFPAFGGYEVETGKTCRIEIREAAAATGQAQAVLAWREFTPGSRAIIDVSVTV